MKTILVIEDDRSIRNNMLKILKVEGFETIGAEDGVAGVQMAKAYTPDLIICDIIMPKLDGYAVLAALAENSETATIPFIFLSAKADRSDIRQGMNSGADDYLTKPFTRQELTEAIAARLGKQQAIAQPYMDEMKRVADSLSKVAYSDPLTSLPNRILLRHQLQEALTKAKRKQQLVAVLCLNLDRFSEINSTFGPTTGDLVLQAVAKRLTQCVGSQDTVARLSADEFSIVLTETTSKVAVAKLVEQIFYAVVRPYNLNEQEITVQASIGIALYPEDSSYPDQLLTYVDTARRWCKKQGGNGYQFYSSQMDTQAAERRALEIDLSVALERSQLEVYYQPQVNLITGRIFGLEALLRWNHPQRGSISPSTFIPVAEETGLIITIGEWVLRTACTQVQAWQTSALMPLGISVNLSARQFKQKNLADMVADVLSKTGLDPKLLVLELTETSVMEDVNAAIRTLEELKAMGIEISIDDFGTGYSSLNYLKRFPIDSLKIDRSFVSHVTEDNHDAAIAKAIIAMAHSLKLKVIAEGVETEKQLTFFRKQGCHGIQGYLYSPPLTAISLEKLLSENKRFPLGKIWEK